MTFLIILLVIIIAVWLYLQQPVFGAFGKGKALKALRPALPMVQAAIDRKGYGGRQKILPVGGHRYYKNVLNDQMKKPVFVQNRPY